MNGWMDRWISGSKYLHANIVFLLQFLMYDACQSLNRYIISTIQFLRKICIVMILYTSTETITILYFN